LFSAVVLWILTAGSLRAADSLSYQQDGSRKAAVRVRNWCDGYMKGMCSSGTGTLTAVSDGRGLVLTAGHLFEGKVGSITVDFSDGQSSGARLLAVDKKLDLAALLIYAPQSIEPIPLTDTDPKLGEKVEIWGYGPKKFRSFLATVSKPIDTNGDQPHSLVGAQGVKNHMVTVPGDSGGPMVQEGKLVGVHWGYRGAANDPRRCVHAVGCHRIRSWLRNRVHSPICENCLAQ